MTGLITTLVGAVVAAGALATTSAAWHGPAQAAAPQMAPHVATQAAAPAGSAVVGVTVPVVAFGVPERLPDGHVRVSVLLTDPGVTATVALTDRAGREACRSPLVQGVPVVLDCASGGSRHLRLAYLLSDGRSSATELPAP